MLTLMGELSSLHDFHSLQSSPFMSFTPLRLVLIPSFHVCLPSSFSADSIHFVSSALNHTVLISCIHILVPCSSITHHIHYVNCLSHSEKNPLFSAVILVSWTFFLLNFFFYLLNFCSYFTEAILFTKHLPALLIRLHRYLKNFYYLCTFTDNLWWTFIAFEIYFFR